MKIDTLYVGLFLVSVLIASVSQIILKRSASETHEGFLKEYLNFRVLIAYVLFFCSSFLTVFSYKKVPLSLGAVLETTGYIWVTVLGFLILKERVNRKKRIGLGLIVIGIIVFNISL